MEKNRLYVLLWIVGGQIKETIGLSNPMKRTVALWKKKRLESSTHKVGILIPKAV
jgi:hypothetical protein